MKSLELKAEAWFLTDPFGSWKGWMIEKENARKCSRGGYFEALFQQFSPELNQIQ